MRIQKGKLQPEIELRFLVITPSSFSTARKEETVARVRKLASMTGGKQCAILFLLAPANMVEHASPLHAFNEFQILLMESRLNVPLLPLDNTSSLAKVAIAFAMPHSGKIPPVRARKLDTSLDLIPYLGRLSRETVLALADLTTCLRDVASIGEEDAQKLLDAGIRMEELEELFTFWNEEFVIDWP
jgi:hypothetical protein